MTSSALARYDALSSTGGPNELVEFWKAAHGPDDKLPLSILDVKGANANLPGE